MRIVKSFVKLTHDQERSVLWLVHNANGETLGDKSLWQYRGKLRNRRNKVDICSPLELFDFTLSLVCPREDPRSSLQLQRCCSRLRHTMQPQG